uniref:Desmoplakin SH3 domain-containing protein n=1 Tax=Echinococcus granulosus TaxID=6210 RepID=A0A068WT49_ECHGR|nr:hypothetical protein EgrG_000701600 [Echinococcus granulosus]
MTTKSGDVKLLEQCLQNFKSRAQEMHVGVNFSALNEERQRQEHLLRELQEIEAELTSPTLSKTNLPHLASLVGVELDQNTRCLHYLTEISELERYVTDVAAHFAERSIELSDPQALHKNVFISKTLSDNVKSCWEYVDQLAMLAQIHIKTAAEYHQFFHEANEVEAKLEKHLRLAQRRQQATTGQESNIKDASKIANELREQLESMRSLWNRCIALVKRSESVVPMRLRLGGVSKSQVTLNVANGQSGPIMVRALICLTGPNYRIQQGELLPLIDNQRDTHLWRVETSSGAVEVPSICFWVTGNDAEATERAVVLKQQCKKVWLEIIRLSRQRLYHEYIDILSHLTSKNVTCTKKEPLEDLLTDIHNHLITQLDDKGRLQTVVENFQRSITISGQRNTEEGFVLRESDLVRLRSPLMRLEDHLMAVGLMQEDMNRLNEYIENYLSEVATEQNRIARMVEQLARITTESQAQLADLVSHLGKFAKAPSGGSQASRPKMDSAYRSRSQPFDLEFKKNLTGRGGGKRARSQTIQLLDAMVQIGTECKSAETQCRDVTSVTDPSPREPKNMAVQLKAHRPPVQRCVITQIGPNSKESCTQVDISDSSYSEECYVAEDMKGIVKRSSREVISDRRRKAVSASALPRRPPVVQVNTCTQLGCMTHERSVSPIHALLQFCPNCQTSEFLEVQKEYGQICSASQRCQPIAYGSLQSETHGNCICKRVQCGFPCLNGRSNLCCQVDVLGPLVNDANVQSQALRCYADIGTTEEVFEVDQEAFRETRFVPSRCHLVCKRVQTGMSKMCNLANSFSQTIRTYARPIRDHMASATQIGIMTKERECSPIPFENVARPVPSRRRYIQAQVQQPQVYDREPMVMVEASKIMDWDLTGAPLQTSHHENLYIEPIRKNLPKLDCSSFFGDPLTPPYTNVMHCSPDLDRIARKAVFSVNSHIGVHPRNGRFETRQRRRKTMLRTASTPETVSPIEVRASPGLYHIASSPNAVTQPVDRCVARLQTRSLPNLLEGESQIETQSTYVPPIRVKSTCSTCKDAAYRSRYATLQAVSGPAAPRRTVRLQSNTLPNGIDREVQIGHAVDLGETQTSELVFSKRLPNEKVIGSCCANAQYVRRTHSQPNVVDSYLRTSRRSVGRSFVETYTSEIPVRQYSVQTCKRVPDVAIAEVSQHTAHMPDVGIAEVQIHPVIHWDNKKVQVHVDVSNPVRRVCVETPSIVRYDVSCDAMIKPARASKKAQVELFEEPIIPERLKEPNVYAEAPVPKITSNVAIQMSESMEAVTTQSAPQMHEKKLQCDPPLPCAVVSCQQSPQTSNKKLQVSVQIPTGMRLGGAEVSPVSKTTYGKKLQVDLSAALSTRQIQTISEPEPEPILMAPPTLQYSAPPTAFEDFSCDAPEPIEVLSKSTQSDTIHVPQTLGKRLQVSMNEPLESSVCQSLMLGVDSFTQFEPEPLAVGVSQSVREEPEPIILKPPTPTPFVMAAPPPSGIDDGCDPIHVATIESSSQAEKMETWGKKLQVNPKPYSTSILNTRYDLPTMHSVSTQVESIQTVGKDVQIKPDPLALCKAQSIWIEQPPITLQRDLTPVYSAPPKETKDFSCDAPLPPQKLGKKLQVSPIPLICTVSQTAYIEPKPAPLESSVTQCREVKNMSEGLQVSPQPLEIGCSQALWTEPPQITLKQEVTPVFSAPPKETKDFSCDAPPPPQMMGKKLQVAPQPLSAHVSQTAYVEPKPASLAIGKSQSMWAETELLIVKAPTPEPVVMSAPPPATHEFGCNPLPVGTQGKKLQVAPEPLSTAIMQSAENPTHIAISKLEDVDTDLLKSVYDRTAVQVKEVQKFSKELQVAPQSLTTAVSQTLYAEPKPALLVVGHSQAIWTEPKPVIIKAPTPEPVVMSAPPPPTHEFGCDPLPVGTQGKKLQVAPEPLSTAIMQSAENPTHIAISKLEDVDTDLLKSVYDRIEVQATPQPLATNVSQTLYAEPKPGPLVVGHSQAIWTEPEPVIIKAPTPEPVVMSAPPPPTHEFGCDPLPVVAPEPLSTAIMQSAENPTHIAISKLEDVDTDLLKSVYDRTAVQVKEVQKFSKELQVAPQSLTTAVSQTLYAEPKPGPLVVGHSQAIWTEPEPVVIKAPTPEPVVMSAPPPPTHEFGCDPLPVGTQGKKLQVAPEPLSTAIMQSAENPTHIAISKLEDVDTDLLKSVYDRTAVQVKEVQKFSKELQVAPQSLTTAVSQTLYAEPKPALLVVGHSQAIWTEPKPVIIKAPTPEPVVMSAPPPPTHEFGCNPLPVGTQGKKLQVTPESLVFASVQTLFTERTRSVYRTAFVQSKDVGKIGKMLQVAPEPLAKVFTQSVYEDPEKPVYNIANTQSGAFKTLAKKLQVQPQPLATASLQAFWAEPEPVLIKSITPEPTVMSAPPVEGRDFSSSPIPQPSANASIQVSPTATFAHRAVDPLPSAECFTKMLQVTPELLGVASLQAIRSESPKPRVCPLSVAHSQTIRESGPSDRGEPLAITTAQSVGVKSFGKKLQVQPIGLSRVSTQTFWEESAVIKAPTLESIVMAAPSSSAHLVSTLVQAEIQPIMPMVEKVNKKLMFRPQLMETTQVQATLSKSELTSMEIQSDLPLPYQPTKPSLQFRGIQAHGDSLKISTSQTEIVEQPLVIQPPSSPVPLYAAPAIKETFDFGTQYEPSMRSVRIQKGAGAFENAIHIGVQNSPSEPRRTPPSPRVHKIDWGIQCKPTVMAGITQTAIVEQIPHPVTPQTYTESTQTEYVESLPPTTKIEVIHRPIKKRKESEPLFSFVRETTAQVSKGCRAKSQGLIPYKTQVATQGQEYSLSVPSMLHLNVLEQGAATMSEQYSYQQQRSTSMNIPRRYASRIRSPSARGTTYAGRNRSMDTIFEDLRNKHMQDSLPRHSEGDLYSENTYVRELLRVQQMQLEERTEESLQHCVQAVGIERVYAMLRHIWEEAEEEKAIHEEMHGGFYTSRTFPGRRYTDVTTQYSIPFYDFHYGYGRKDAATQEGISHVQWIPIPPGHFVQIESDGSTDIDETYDWDPDLSSWHPKRNLFKWLARTPLDFGTQTDVTKAEENQYIDRLLRSRALSAYTSDFEMQQAGLKLNYPESGTVSVVSWRPRYLDGEDQLDVDTIGQLLRVSLVGARVPGTGEVISAADAFYRGILRIVYVDDSRGTIMPLPTAITANAVIVEKQYPRGVGIALHSTSRKYPVECQVLWNTSTLRRRTYRVNFIQKSTEERVNLSTALEEGLIDLTSGELVKIPMPSTSTLPDPLLESRESTLGAGETTPVIPHPERYSVHEAILNDILNVDLLAPEAVIFPSTEAIQESVAREGEAFFSSPGPDEESDMEV